MSKNFYTLQERLDTRKRVAPNGCWLWTGAKNPKGYGWTCRDGKQGFVHRFAYEFYIGKIPKGHGVLHRCDNPSCFNPAHLFTGTQLDNIRDAQAKGRVRCHPNTTRLAIVLDTDLYQQAREMARLDKRDFSSFIAVILERAVSMREAA